MAFKAIETQEQLDSIIEERIGRAKDSVRKEFEGFISPDDVEEKLSAKVKELNDQITSLNQQISDKDNDIADKAAKIKGYETNSAKMRIIRDKNLPYEAIDFLTGEDEESISSSAEAFAAVMNKTKGGQPGANTESLGGEETDPKDEAYKAMLKELSGKE